MTASPDDRQPLPGSEPRTGMNRRKLVAGTAVAGLSGAGIFRIARAQDDAGTPDATADEATSSGTPEATTGQDTEQDDATVAAAAIARADEVITSVGADRDAIASDIDTTEIDSLIDQAGVHRDLATSSIAAGDNAEAIRQAFVAVATARSARELIETGLGYAGLPSEEVRASRTLARVHETIVAVTEESASATDPNVEFFVSHAQALYTTAYDLHGTGAYAQAIGNGRVAGRLAWIATALMADISEVGQNGIGRGGRGGRGDAIFGGDRRGPGRGGPGVPGGRMGPGDRAGDDLDDALDDGSDTDATPEPVPAPEF